MGHSMISLNLRLFGHPVVTLNGQQVFFETRKSLAILIYIKRNEAHLAKCIYPCAASKGLIDSLFQLATNPKRYARHATKAPRETSDR